ncbi:hypothetical protein Tco_0907671 [Tanacetum coccineum]|uniref:Uncharacterized protein n=1 Tax=Tanacetum coccineum TaxID=301880 RepID=A0ABQ5CJX6_9ASTR
MLVLEEYVVREERRADDEEMTEWVFMKEIGITETLSLINRMPPSFNSIIKGNSTAQDSQGKEFPLSHFIFILVYGRLSINAFEEEVGRKNGLWEVGQGADKGVPLNEYLVKTLRPKDEAGGRIAILLLDRNRCCLNWKKWNLCHHGEQKVPTKEFASSEKFDI